MSSEESHSGVKTPKKRKRGVLNPDTYQRNVIKKSRVQGKEYVTYKGKTITQKTPPDEISCKCPAKCFKLVTKELLTEIWNKFYSMGSKNAQDRYLQTLIWRKEVKRRRKRKLTLPIEHRVETKLTDEEIDSPTIHRKSKLTLPIEHHNDAKVTDEEIDSPTIHRKSKLTLPIEHHNETKLNDDGINFPTILKKSKLTLPIGHHDGAKLTEKDTNSSTIHRKSKLTLPIEHHVETKLIDDEINSPTIHKKSKLTLPIEHHSEAKVTDEQISFPTIQECTNHHQQHSKRSHTFLYNLRISGAYQRVCKNVFMSTHGIKADRVRRLCCLLLARQISEDRRGKNRSGNKISDEICAQIHEHINSFEVKKALFGRKLTKYLDAQLNILKMHQMFVKDHPDLESKVKYSFYYNYFKENFGYAFGRPAVDVYNQCESLQNFRELQSCLKEEPTDE